MPLTQELEWAKQERGRRGKEWWMKLVCPQWKPGTGFLCNGLSRNCFLPCGGHFKFSLSVVKWYLWLQIRSPGWLERLREDQEPQNVLSQEPAQALNGLGQSGWSRRCRAHPHLPWVRCGCGGSWAESHPPSLSNSYRSLFITLMCRLFHCYVQYQLLLASCAPRCFLRSVTKL